MSDSSSNRVEMIYSKISENLKDQNTRELWFKLKNELLRVGGGPDACTAHLDSELTQMEEQIRRGLSTTTTSNGN